MYDHILIYVIVSLNALCQLMLIWRQKRINNVRWLFMAIAVALPLLTAVIMRTLVACGAINGHVAEQSRTEHLVTSTMSMLLIAGPWLVTFAAVFTTRARKRTTITI
jgi:ABC-type multidrug transport system permease subunit